MAFTKRNKNRYIKRLRRFVDVPAPIMIGEQHGIRQSDYELDLVQIDELPVFVALDKALFDPSGIDQTTRVSAKVVVDIVSRTEFNWELFRRSKRSFLFTCLYRYISISLFSINKLHEYNKQKLRKIFVYHLKKDRYKQLERDTLYQLYEDLCNLEKDLHKIDSFLYERVNGKEKMAAEQKLASIKWHDFKSRSIPPRIRYLILIRDSMSCVICGRNSTKLAKIGEHLAVDHIIPVSKGGRTTPANLRTLCRMCNAGKGNLYL